MAIGRASIQFLAFFVLAFCSTISWAEKNGQGTGSEFRFLPVEPEPPTKPTKPNKPYPGSPDGDIIPMPFPGPEPIPDDGREPLPEAPPLPNPVPEDRERSRERAEAGEEQINQDPRPLPGRTGRVAREYMRGGDPAGAERVLDRLIGAGGADPEAYRLRSAARFQQEKWAGAYTDARTALDSNPSDKIAADLAGTSRMQLERLGLKPPQARPIPERRDETPKGEPQPERGGPAFQDTGTVALLGGKETVSDPRRNFFMAIDRKIAIGGRREAILGLTQYLDRNPQDATALWKRAYLLNRERNPDAALADSDRALAISPQDAAALREKAYALVQLGRGREALALLEEAMRIQPNNALGFLYRAMAYKALGDKTGALSDFKHAATLDAALKSYYDEALAELGGHPRSAEGAGANWRIRGIVALLALPLLLLGARNAMRHYSGRTTGSSDDVEGPAPAAPASATLVDGNVLGGLYRVGRVLGRGGMGVVFEAWDLGLERKVAIKQLRAPEGSGADYDRFLKEARLVAKLQHPNIVQIHTLVEDNSLLYLVFELVEGRGLDSVLAEKGRISLQDTRRVVRDVCAALDHAHEGRIIHRDLKPSNIMMTAKGTFKVMDFGIAHQAQSDQMLTQTGAWGTPPYMAPEQEQGLVSKESDLYALGCTVYELLTGSRPFGPGSSKMSPSFKPPSTLVHGAAPAIDAFMAKALAPAPEHRFHSAREFATAFEACVNGRIAA